MKKEDGFDVWLEKRSYQIEDFEKIDMAPSFGDLVGRGDCIAISNLKELPGLIGARVVYFDKFGRHQPTYFETDELGRTTREVRFVDVDLFGIEMDGEVDLEDGEVVEKIEKVLGNKGIFDLLPARESRTIKYFEDGRVYEERVEWGGYIEDGKSGHGVVEFTREMRSPMMRGYDHELKRETDMGMITCRERRRIRAHHLWYLVDPIDYERDSEGIAKPAYYFSARIGRDRPAVSLIDENPFRVSPDQAVYREFESGVRRVREIISEQNAALNIEKGK